MRKRLLVSLLASLFFAPAGRMQAPPAVQNASGMRLVVADENSYPTLRVVLPGHPDSDKTIEVIFPEHVTVRHVGDTEGKHLFLFQPCQHGDRPAWRQVGRSLQYEKDFEGGLHMLATAMLEDDGVRFSYEFVNRSLRHCPEPAARAVSPSGLRPPVLTANQRSRVYKSAPPNHPWRTFQYGRKPDISTLR